MMLDEIDRLGVTLAVVLLCLFVTALVLGAGQGGRDE